MADLTPLQKALDRRVDALGVRFRDSLQKELRQDSPRKTGVLERSQTVDYTRTPNSVKWTAKAEAPYALFVARGTRPHVIRPSRKTVLRFMGRRGVFVFARSVNHPGTRPNRWWDDTLTDYRQLLSRVWRETEGIR